MPSLHSARLSYLFTLHNKVFTLQNRYSHTYQLIHKYKHVMVRIKLRTKTSKVYYSVHVRTYFLPINAKSLLLMARAANPLSLHFLLAFKYLSLHCFSNNIQCRSTERSGCTLTFTVVECLHHFLQWSSTPSTFRCMVS